MPGGVASKNCFHYCSNVSNQETIRRVENHDPTTNIWVDNKLNELKLLTEHEKTTILTRETELYPG